MYPGNPPLNLTHNVLHVLSESGQVYGMHYGGVPGQGNKPGDYPGTLHAPSRAGRCDNSGQGKNIPYSLQLLQHVLTMGGPQRPPPCHHLVCQGGESEMVLAVC